MNFCRYKAVQHTSVQFEEILMKRLVLALVLIPAVLVSVSRADIATPFPTRHSVHNARANSCEPQPIRSLDQLKPVCARFRSIARTD